MINKSTFYRLQQLAISWTTVGIIYGATRFTPGKPSLLSESWLDRQIPFNPAGVWLYLAFFLFVPWAFLSAETTKLLRLRYAIQLSAIISGLTFVLYPTTLTYPPIASNSIHAMATQWLLAIDTPQNCLPSLHGALMVSCLIALWNWQKKLHSIIYLSISLAIVFSIIQLRRHLTIDVSAGILVGIASYYFAALKTTFGTPPVSNNDE